jgi:hypothetical protein
LDGEYASELDPDVDMRMEDDVDAPDSVDLDHDVDMKRDGEDDEDEDDEGEDEEKEDEEVVEEEDEHEEEDKDEDDGKQHQKIGQGEIVFSLADDVDTMVDNQPIVLPGYGQEMREHTSRPQLLACATQLQTPAPRPQPRNLDTVPLSGLEHLGHVRPQKPRPAVPTLHEAEATGDTSDVDVDQQLLIESGRW